MRLIVTEETLKKPAPRIVTVAPTPPMVGVNDDIVGGAMSVKALLDAVPPGPVTVTGPKVAALGTVALIWPALTTVKVAAPVPKRTLVTPVKLTPRIVT